MNESKPYRNLDSDGKRKEVRSVKVETAKSADVTVGATPKIKPKKKRFKTFRDNFELSILALPATLLLFVFCYIPMFGVIMSFKDYKAARGILESDWSGLENFRFFFTSNDAWVITRNTVGLNILFIATNLIVAVAIALMLYEVTSKWCIKIYQTCMIFPNFLSWVVVGLMFYAFFSPAEALNGGTRGMANQWIVALGGKGVNWYGDAGLWPTILTIASLWKTVGYNSIVYYAALMGVDSSYFEAAAIDGANKLQTIRKISIPFLIPTMTVLTILAIGGIFRQDFGKFYYLTRDVAQLKPTTNVIDTYIYSALKTSKNYGMTAAVGLFQSFVGFVMVVLTNTVVKKIDPNSALY